MRPRQFGRSGPLIVFLSALIAVTGCAPVPHVDEPERAQVRQVLAPPPGVSPEVLEEEPAALLAVSPEMKQFLRSVLPPQGRAQDKFDAIYNALRYNSAYVLQYDALATLTAAEAFRQRRGNCLSFAAMFIALAREAGLDARFQQVDVPPSWDAAGRDTLVQYRHVNVLSHITPRRTGVVDLRLDLYSESDPRRPLSDREALAHYYSNISMDHLFNGRLAEAWVAARRAIEADEGESSFIWNNMGIVQRRLGNEALAEASFRQALTIDPQDWSALSNLSHIYARRGEKDEAERLRALGDQIRLRDPYYRYALAENAYRRGAYGEALTQLDAALDKRGDHRFYYLRGLSLWQLGQTESAISDLRRAIEVSEDSKPLALYQRQLDAWQDSRG